ncbi:hypothetical protein [Psychrobacter sp. I-STPA10]|uniref:hypothetical protein n=1 Tax=Psychrobacter sp. I-STPA10 TaxID=2585769 RepID=UPI001E37C2A1|nr:hypothetical protein [Psychrobacter sp. I-STPA10]
MNLITWNHVNDAIPFIGITLCAFMMFSRKSCTKQKTISTIVILLALMWLTLTWADFASDVFHASLQTMSARIILLITMILIVMYVRSMTGNILNLVNEIKRLKAVNQSLINKMQQKSGGDKYD